MANNHFQTFQDSLCRHKGWPLVLVDPQEEYQEQPPQLKEMLNSSHDTDHHQGQYLCLQVLPGISHQYHPNLNLNKPLPNHIQHKGCMDLEEGEALSVPHPTSIPIVHRGLGRRPLHHHRPRQNLTTVCLNNNNPLSLSMDHQYPVLYLGLLQDLRLLGVAVCNN